MGSKDPCTRTGSALALGIKNKKNTYVYTRTMSNKVAVFSQLLNELRQNVIRAECEEDLRYSMLPHYPTELIAVTDHMVELINEATEFLREIQKTEK